MTTNNKKIIKAADVAHFLTIYWDEWEDAIDGYREHTGSVRDSDNFERVLMRCKIELDKKIAYYLTHHKDYELDGLIDWYKLLKRQYEEYQSQGAADACEFIINYFEDEFVEYIELRKFIDEIDDDDLPYIIG